MSAEAKFTARLTRGESYYLTDFHFPKSVRIVVTETTKLYLEETAIDEVAGEVDPETGTMEVVQKPKFIFEEYEGDAAVGSMIPDPVADAVPSRRRVQKKVA